MGEFLDPMGRYGSAAVKSRIDRWSERDRGLDDRVECQPEFPEQFEIRPIPCGADDTVNWRQCSLASEDDDSLARALQAIDEDTTVEHDPISLECTSETLTEASSLWQLVLEASQATSERAAPDRPVHDGAWFLLSQTDEIEKGSEGRVSCAHDERSCTSIPRPIAAKHVRHTVVDRIRTCSLADRWPTAPAEGIGNRSRGIEDSPGEEFLLTGGCHHPDGEGAASSIVPGQLVTP
jgi:hypothetical protein